MTDIHHQGSPPEGSDHGEHGKVFLPESRRVGLPFAEVTLDIDGEQRRLADLTLDGNYVIQGGEEWIVPARWAKHRVREKAFWKTGMFANQNSANKLRNRFTLDQLTTKFGLDDDVAESD